MPEIILEEDYAEANQLRISIDKYGMITITRSGMSGKMQIWFGVLTANKIRRFLTKHLGPEEPDGQSNPIP